MATTIHHFGLKKKNPSSLSVPKFAHWGFQASIFPVLTVPSISTSSPQSHKRSTHPLLLSCCHGNHHCVANGESKEEVQVRICTMAASTALHPTNPLKQLPVWNHLCFLLACEKKMHFWTLDSENGRISALSSFHPCTRKCDQTLHRGKFSALFETHSNTTMK